MKEKLNKTFHQTTKNVKQQQLETLELVIPPLLFYRPVNKLPIANFTNLYILALISNPTNSFYHNQGLP